MYEIRVADLGFGIKMNDTEVKMKHTGGRSFDPGEKTYDSGIRDPDPEVRMIVVLHFDPGNVEKMKTFFLEQSAR